MLDRLVPSWRPEIQLHARDDGTAVVANSRAGSFLGSHPSEASLAALIDGKLTVAEIVAAHFAKHGAVSFIALGELLARLRRAGALANSEAELDNAGVARAEEKHVALRISSVVIGRIRGPLAAMFALAGAPLALVACVATAFAPRHPRALGAFDPLLPGGSALAGLLGVLFGVSLALTLRSLVRAFTSAMLGAKPGAFELRLYAGLPVFVAEGGQVQLLSRPKRIAAYFCTLAAPWALALAAGGMASRGSGGPALASLALGAALVGFFDAMPFGAGSLGHALTALGGQVDLRDHARAYLTKRFISRLGSQARFAGERAIIVTSVLSVLWILLTIRIMNHAGAPQLSRLIHRALSAHGIEALASRVAALCVLAGVVAVVLQLGGILFVVVRALAPGLFQPRLVAGKPSDLAPADAVEALRRVAIFASLAPATLAEIAREAVSETFRPGAVIVRQGDAGDRFYAVVTGQLTVLREHESGLSEVIATLGQGDGFGETALLQPVARTATVRALGEVQLLSIPRAGFLRVVESQPGVDFTRALRATAALRRSSLGAVIPAERFAEITPRLVARAMAAQEVVCKLGEPGDFFYIIDQGEVEVLGKDGTRLQVLGPGESFGETALLMETMRTATVRALGPTALWALARVDLYSVLSRNAALSEALVRRAETRVA